jgi:hypothetical protein
MPRVVMKEEVEMEEVVEVEMEEVVEDVLELIEFGGSLIGGTAVTLKTEDMLAKTTFPSVNWAETIQVPTWSGMKVEDWAEPEPMPSISEMAVVPSDLDHTKSTWVASELADVATAVMPSPSVI